MSDYRTNLDSLPKPDQKQNYSKSYHNSNTEALVFYNYLKTAATSLERNGRIDGLFRLAARRGLSETETLKALDSVRTGGEA